MNKILVVDDDAELRAKLSKLLKDAGYNVEEAASGGEAISKVRLEFISLVLLDYLMPEMNGMETLIELRRVSPKTKVIMITAYAQVEKAVNAIKIGATDFISKPFNFEELISVINQSLEEASFEESLKKLSLTHSLSAISQPIRRKIMRILMSLKSVHYTEIARELGLNDFSKIAFHLKVLKEVGIIEQDKDKLYSLTKEGRKIVDGLNFLETYLADR